MTGSTFDGIVGSQSAEFGGGIFNQGTATVKDSTFTSDSAYDGAGIFNQGTITVTGSIFADNLATNGGGIWNSGTLVNTKNVFLDNTGGDIYRAPDHQTLCDANQASSRPMFDGTTKESFVPTAQDRPGGPLSSWRSMPRPLS